MARLAWDQVGERFFEAGVDRGVLYPSGSTGVAWNGLMSVEEAVSGGDSEPLYFDGVKYLDSMSNEDFEATLQAYTYPDEFAACEGTVEISPGMVFTHQTRRTFGLTWRTRIGNDTQSVDYGYKIHLVYNATAAPTTKAHESISDAPTPSTFSWTINAVPNMPGQDLLDQNNPSGWAWPEGSAASAWPKAPNSTTPVAAWKPTAYFVVDSTEVNSTIITTLENQLYGTSSAAPYLPKVFDLVSLLSGH